MLLFCKKKKKCFRTINTIKNIFEYKEQIE